MNAKTIDSLFLSYFDDCSSTALFNLPSNGRIISSDELETTWKEEALTKLKSVFQHLHKNTINLRTTDLRVIF
jgi:hypothetical protein